MKMKSNKISKNLIVFVMGVLDLIHTNYNHELIHFCY